jgi:hypothetical protein
MVSSSIFLPLVLGVGGVVGLIWPYTQYSNTNLKDHVFDVMTNRAFLILLSCFCVGLVIKGYSNMTGKPKIITKTLGLILITEALLIAGAMSIGWLEFSRKYGYTDDGEEFAALVLLIANYFFIPIAASKLVWDFTDSRKRSLIAGIMTLGIAGLLMPVIMDNV